MILGLFDAATFEEDTVILEPGDRLVAFSDGVFEAVNAAGEQFGEDRVADCIRADPASEPADVLETILERVREFTAGTPQMDDMTVLVIRYNGV